MGRKNTDRETPVHVNFRESELAYMRERMKGTGIRAMTEYIRFMCLQGREEWENRRGIESSMNRLKKWLLEHPGEGNDIG